MQEDYEQIYHRPWTWGGYEIDEWDDDVRGTKYGYQYIEMSPSSSLARSHGIQEHHPLPFCFSWMGMSPDNRYDH